MTRPFEVDDRDRQFLLAPKDAPFAPIVPLKNYQLRDETGRPSLAIVNAMDIAANRDHPSHQIPVYLGGIYQDTPKGGRPSILYTDLEALLAAGWMVD